MKIRAIIVDDEEPARLNLRELLRMHCKQVEVVALCASADEARKALLMHAPSLMFLDISMPEETGIELLASINSIKIHVIFTTAYQEHAIKAFELRAVDYLLKPILSNRLMEAVSRIMEPPVTIPNIEKPEVIDTPDSTKSDSRQLLPLPTLDGIELVEPADIIRFVANGPKTIAFISNGTSMVLSKHLKIIAQSLDERFQRTHHSHMVNIEHIRKFSKLDGGFLVMSDDSEVEVSRRRKTEIFNLIADRIS